MQAALAAPSAPTNPAERRLQVVRLGRVPYREALQLQAECHLAVCEGRAPDTLLVLEHPPVITLGRAANAANVLVDEAALAARGIEVVATGRGGDVTYHGPGQLVVYPIVALGEGERDVRQYVWRLEELVLRCVAHFGVRAERVAGLRGLWVGNEKIAAIGIRLMRWVSCHGLALNVRTNLDDFATIVPCGLHGRGVTSLARLVPPGPDVDEAAEALLAHAPEVLQRRCEAANQVLTFDAAHAARARTLML